jgi:hypothetical protein
MIAETSSTGIDGVELVSRGTPFFYATKECPHLVLAFETLLQEADNPG